MRCEHHDAAKNEQRREPRQIEALHQADVVETMLRGFEYAANHITRLQANTPQSIETSSLHLGLISDLKRINAHPCGVAYPILESAGALSATRIRASVVGE